MKNSSLYSVATAIALACTIHANHAIALPQQEKTATVSAQSGSLDRHGESLFKVGSDELTSTAKRNLDTFVANLKLSLRDDRLVSLNVTGSCSPEGSEDFNSRLARRRAAAVADYLAGRLDLPAGRIDVGSKGENWPYFKTLVSGDSDLPGRKALLDIIDSDRTPAAKEKAIRALGPQTWTSLENHIFPQMRMCAITATLEKAGEVTDTIADSRPAITPLPQPEPEPAPEPEPVVEEVTEEVVETAEPVAEEPQWQRHAYVKTNLPAWVMLWINAAGEIDIDPHWSANLSIYYSGFNYFTSDTKFRTFTVMPEVRYWPKAENQGFFVGGHFGLAYYNCAFGGDYRYQDHYRRTPALGGGVNLGFRFPLRNRRWKMEFSIGAGIYHLDYDVFNNYHNGLIVDRRKRTFYGIDNAAFSIAYTFDVRKKGAAAKGGEP